MTDFRYQSHSYPSLSLINDFINNANIDTSTALEYINWYHEYKKIENKFLNFFSLTDEEKKSHLVLGEKLKKLLYQILSKQ